MTNVDCNDNQDDRRPQEFDGQLRRLIAVLRAPGEPPLSDRAIAARVRANGGSISASYIADLRTGSKKTPSLAHAQQLAAALGVSAGYFTDPEVYERVSQELDRIEQISQQSNSEHLVELATRMASLSDSDRDVLSALVQRELAARRSSGPDSSPTH